MKIMWFSYLLTMNVPDEDYSKKTNSIYIYVFYYSKYRHFYDIETDLQAYGGHNIYWLWSDVICAKYIIHWTHKNALVLYLLLLMQLKPQSPSHKQSFLLLLQVSTAQGKQHQMSQVSDEYRHRQSETVSVKMTYAPDVLTLAQYWDVGLDLQGSDGATE
jgi:hypothetical protein